MARAVLIPRVVISEEVSWAVGESERWVAGGGRGRCEVCVNWKKVVRDILRLCIKSLVRWWCSG